MLRRILLTAASAVALTAAANAADVYSPAGGYKDSFVPLTTWTGFYVGASVGPDWSQTSYLDANSSGSKYSAGSISTDHAFGGGQLGYNFQSGHLVFGIEADLGSLDLAGSILSANGLDKYGVNGGFYGDVTGRLGYAVDRTLLYAKGGAAWLDSKFSSTYGGTYYSSSETLSGWTAGAGIEFLLFPKWSIKAEYLHFGFENSTSFGDSGSYKVHFDPSVDTVKLGVNYHVHGLYEPLK